MTILKEISSRRSIRAFDSRMVSDEILLNLFEAARWAPSSFNEQPWRFIFSRKEHGGAFEKMLGCLNERNREWAAEAAVLLLCIAKLHATEREVPNKHAYYDLGLAVGNLSVQATSMDLFMRQMAGFHPETARSMYSIPDGFDPVSIIALGYQGDSEKLPEALRKREKNPRIRKPLQDLVFEDSFGNSSKIISTEA